MQILTQDTQHLFMYLHITSCYDKGAAYSHMCIICIKTHQMVYIQCNLPFSSTWITRRQSSCLMLRLIFNDDICCFQSGLASHRYMNEISSATGLQCMTPALIVHTNSGMATQHPAIPYYRALISQSRCCALHQDFLFRCMSQAKVGNSSSKQTQTKSNKKCELR